MAPAAPVILVSCARRPHERGRPCLTAGARPMAARSARRRRPEKWHDLSVAFLPVPFLASLLLDHPVSGCRCRGGIAVACGRIRCPTTLRASRTGPLPHLPSANHCVRRRLALADPSLPRQLQPVVGAMPGTRIETGAEPGGHLPPCHGHESRLFGFMMTRAGQRPRPRRPAVRSALQAG